MESSVCVGLLWAADLQPSSERLVRIKTVFLSLILMCASIAIAQVPCGPAIMPKATLFVDWPQLGFDGAHSACNPYETILGPANVGNLTLAWTYPTIDGYSPVVANGAVYVGDATGTLYSLNAANGTPLWTYQVPQDYCLATPAVANGIAYFGCTRENNYNGSDGIFALDAGTGALRWSVGEAGFGFSIVNGILYYAESLGGLIGRVAARNAATGEYLWGYEAGFNVTAPVVANGIVYFGATDKNVYALNATTGALIWQAQTIDTPYVGPAADGRVYVTAGGYPEEDLYAFNAATGALIWQKSGFSLAGGIAHGVLYATARGLYALNGSTGDVIWNFPLGGANLAVANGVVYTCDCGENLYAVDANTGAQLWNYPADYYGSSPAVANGMLYIGTIKSGMLAFHLPGH